MKFLSLIVVLVMLIAVIGGITLIKSQFHSSHKSTNHIHHDQD